MLKPAFLSRGNDRGLSMKPAVSIIKRACVFHHLKTFLKVTPTKMPSPTIWPSSPLFGFPCWLLSVLLFLLASIDFRCSPPSESSADGGFALFCAWTAFSPPAFCLSRWANHSSSFSPSQFPRNCASDQIGSVAAATFLGTAEGSPPPQFDWVRPKKGRMVGGRRPPLDMANDDGEEEEESFFFQMDEMPAGKKSREKELHLKRASKEKASKEAARKSREGKLTGTGSSRSAERRRTATYSPTLPTSTPMASLASKFVDERKRSASKEILEKATANDGGSSTTSPPPQSNGGEKHGHHHNITVPLSSHHHKKGGGGQTTKIGQRKMGGGGNKQGNWHELSSTEQSIALMLRCQELETRELLPSATACRNLRSDKVCTYLFHEVDRKSGRRDVKCNLQGLEDIAESCRKTCGICCEDINYACEDDKNGIIDCTRQLEKCHQKKWFGVLSRFCAGSCGLCAMNTCRDYDNSCRVRKGLCLKSDSVDYMRENCARTCGFCVVGEDGGGGGGKGGKEGGAEKTVISGKPVVVVEQRPAPLTQHRLIVPECTDKAANCTTNAHLCGSPQYGEYMVKFCTKTCLKCGQPHASKNGGDDKFPQPPPLEVVIQPLLGETATGGGGGEKRRMARKCEDQSEKCAQWKLEGLCKVPAGDDDGKKGKFMAEQRTTTLCPKSCGHCQ